MLCKGILYFGTVLAVFMPVRKWLGVLLIPSAAILDYFTTVLAGFRFVNDVNTYGNVTVFFGAKLELESFTNLRR